MPATGVSGVDLYGKDKRGKWRFLDNGRPKGVSNRASFKITPGQPCLLFLPLYNGVKSVEIGIPPGKKLRPLVRSRRKPIVIYGTSITQGACASRPGMAFPAIVARELETPVINLGFSGSGKMEPEMADLIAELDPSIFVLDCLRNMSVEMTQTRIEPFVKKLRAAHPDTPIVLAEEADFRDNTPTAKGRVVRESYERLKEQGIKNLHLLSTKGMLGADHEGTVDKTHPNDLGMMRQAKVFIKTLRPILKTTDSSM
jgi:lysophospholipase L1-like esterase